jgi:sugar-specific transcriptional regulator TrmB
LTELYDVIGVIGVFLQRHHDLHNPIQVLMPESSLSMSIARTQSCIESIKLEATKNERATERAVNTFWETIHNVENLLNNAQNQVYYSSHSTYALLFLTTIQTVTFSTLSSEDLMKVGVERKHLALVDANISKLTKELTTDAEAQIADLNSRIEEIYECVNMDARLALITFAFGR